MSKFMKMLNNISRSRAIYRHNKISAEDLQNNHYAFALFICREPGRSQDELNIFDSVLRRMQEKAREIIEKQEVSV